jgi:hypothetical protein
MLYRTDSPKIAPDSQSFSNRGCNRFNNRDVYPHLKRRPSSFGASGFGEDWRKWPGKGRWKWDLTSVGFDVIIRVPSRVPSLPEFSCLFPTMAEKDSGFSISSTSGDEASKLEIDIQSARLPSRKKIAPYPSWWYTGTCGGVASIKAVVRWPQCQLGIQLRSQS